MTTLLKSARVDIGASRRMLGLMPEVSEGESAGKAGIVLAGPTQAEQYANENAVLRSRIAELESARAAQEAKFGELEQRAFQQGKAEGIALGIAQAERDEEARTHAMREGVHAALTRFSQQLQAVETLALDMTQAALEKIIGDTSHHAEWIAKTIRHQLSAIDPSAVIALRVSAHDYPDAATLRALICESIRADKLDIRIDTQLPTGACLLELKAEKLDIGLRQQLGHMTQLLETLKTDG